MAPFLTFLARKLQNYLDFVGGSFPNVAPISVQTFLAFLLASTHSTPSSNLAVMAVHFKLGRSFFSLFTMSQFDLWLISMGMNSTSQPFFKAVYRNTCVLTPSPDPKSIRLNFFSPIVERMSRLLCQKIFISHQKGQQVRVFLWISQSQAPLSSQAYFEGIALLSCLSPFRTSFAKSSLLATILDVSNRISSSNGILFPQEIIISSYQSFKFQWERHTVSPTTSYIQFLDLCSIFFCVFQLNNLKYVADVYSSKKMSIVFKLHKFEKDQKIYMIIPCIMIFARQSACEINFQQY